MARFRHYSTSDRSACLAVFDSNCPRFLHPSERPGFGEWLHRVTGTFLVLEADEQVIACGGYVQGAGDVALTWGLLHAGQHGRQLGELLLVERLCRAIDEAEVQSSRLATTPRVAPFFARVGYRHVADERDGWGPGMDRVEMRLDFTVEVVSDLRRRRSSLSDRHIDA